METLVNLRRNKPHKFSPNRCLFGPPDPEDCDQLVTDVRQEIVLLTNLENLKNSIKKHGNMVQRNLFNCRPELGDIDRMLLEQEEEDKARIKERFGFDLDCIEETERQNLAMSLKKRKRDHRGGKNERGSRKRLFFGVGGEKNCNKIIDYFQARKNVQEKRDKE